MTAVEFPQRAAPPVEHREFDRTPPQNIEAEQSVLGGMLLSKDAIADVVEVLRPGDFYRPAHQVIYEAAVDLYGRGEPVDQITVAAELTRTGEIGRIGGATYLIDLASAVPTAASAGYYAKIVAEQAILRRLVEAGTRIVQLGYGGRGGEVDDIVDRAQQAIFDVTERRTSEDYIRLEDLLQPTLDEIEAIGSRDGDLHGVPTGFKDLDALTNGLHPGQLVILAARPAIGKALALDTPLPTPAGWTTMGEVAVGDLLLDRAGRPTPVVAATEVMTGRPCYEVEFADGTVVVADAGHQWLTDTRASRRPRGGAVAAVRTTAEIAATLRCETADRRLNHSVPNAAPLDLPAADLPLSPYVLGAWLGDSHSAAARITTGDPEMVLHLEDEGYAGDVLDDVLGPLGVLGDRQIPAAYLRASEAQRRALLSGLMDSAGVVTPKGQLQVAVSSQRLAEDVRELVASLGYRVSLCTPRSAAPYVLNFTTSDDVFRLERKRLAHKDRRGAKGDVRNRSRFIVAVRPIASVPVRCVEVGNAEHLYLATRSMIPTHNSTLGLDFCRAASIKSGKTSVIFSLEMSKHEITMRLLSAEARVSLQNMRTGRMTDDDWSRLARRMGEVANAPLFIDDSPNLTMMEIRAKARRLKQRQNLELIVVDYMQLMSSPRKVENRQQEVSEISRSMKLLAKELEVPVVAISQLNRGPESRTDKKPQLSDLRESGCLTADTRVLRADTGAEVTLGELLETGATNVPVWSVDESLRLRAATMTHVFPSGAKEVFRLRLTSGREVKASANHPFLTLDGWRRLDQLTPATRIATPRTIAEPANCAPAPEAEVVLLAHLLGDGSFVRNQPIRYAGVDEANLTAVSEAARHFGITAVRDDHPAARCVTLRLPAPYHLTHGRRNPVAAWLDKDGLFGARSHEKFVPGWVFGLPREQVALFLRHLWATDGSVSWDARHGQCRLYYASTSRRLVDDVARLLLRFGITARIKRVTKAGYRDGYHLDVYGVDFQRRFLDEIGVHGARSARAAEAAPELRQRTVDTNVDTIPREVWHRVREALAEQRTTHRQFAAAKSTPFCGSTMWKPAPSRSRLARVADVLGDADLDLVATSDVFWDEVASIESLGVQETYDATVEGTHNFVADGVVVHNSLEQDADMVVLLYREDAFEKESPRAGEADFIVAKHRNGPTGTITVAFQGHYSRFIDMTPTG